MNKENTDRLFAKYKFFHPEDRSSLMMFGFDHGDGWNDLITVLCEGIQSHLDGLQRMAVFPESPFEVLQVKEKFGTLRFYTNWTDSEIDKLIGEAEAKSAKTCEFCGKDGKRRGGGWVRTLCDGCDEEYQKGKSR